MIYVYRVRIMRVAFRNFLDVGVSVQWLCDSSVYL
jgi:hypothetical protein